MPPTVSDHASVFRAAHVHPCHLIHCLRVEVRILTLFGPASTHAAIAAPLHAAPPLRQCLLPPQALEKPSAQANTTPLLGPNVPCHHVQWLSIKCGLWPPSGPASTSMSSVSIPCPSITGQLASLTASSTHCRRAPPPNHRYRGEALPVCHRPPQTASTQCRCPP
jgi:hypothetical protein